MRHFRRSLLFLTAALAACSLPVAPAFAQTTPTWQWAAAAGSASSDEGTAIALDAADNTYVTGVAGPGARFGTVTLPGQGGSDVFVAKYSPAGVLLWVRGGGSTRDDESNGIAVDAAGNCYVAGAIGGPATFGTVSVPGAGIGADDAFVLSYYPAGTIRWVRTTTGGGKAADGLALDAAGNVYVAGYFIGQASFGAITLTNGATDSDVFVASYTSAGTVRWARQFGGTNTEFVSAIGVNAAGDYYVTGSFDQATTIGTTTLTALGATDAFLAKFNAAGAVQWAAAFGGAGGDTTPRGLAVSATGECYVVGDSDAPTLDFGLFQQQNPSASQGYVVR